MVPTDSIFRIFSSCWGTYLCHCSISLFRQVLVMLNNVPNSLLTTWSPQQVHQHSRPTPSQVMTLPLSGALLLDTGLAGLPCKEGENTDNSRLLWSPSNHKWLISHPRSSLTTGPQTNCKRGWKTPYSLCQEVATE